MKCYNCNAKSLKYDPKKDSYICSHCGYEYPKQYFFISHSHLDIEKVRLIRDTIEETFFYEPILFFLKCLSDENELQELLQREISERIWFIYCKSENAEKSKYVQQEREYVNHLIDNGKKIHIIEVELDKYNIWNNKIYNYIKSQIAFQIKKTKLFISYSMYDRNLFFELKLNLTNAGYSVWDASDILIADNWQDSIISHIKEHSYKDGAFLYLVTNESLNSNAMKMEIEYAIHQKATLLPIILYDDNYTAKELQFKLYKQLPHLSKIMAINIRQNAIKEDIDKLINGLNSLSQN